jgi:RNA polymerase sigma-70 factor (ECF subfamily)
MDTGYTDSVRRFYEEYRQELFTYAVALSGSRAMAEDAVHEAFCRILQRPRTPDNFRAYVFRAVRNAAIDDIRHRTRETPSESIFSVEVVGHEAEGRDEQRLAVHLLDILSPDERECIVLKLFNDLTFREVAAVRGVSLNTAASWYRRGLEKLRAEYNAQQEPSPCARGSNHA